ncbi:MAG: Gfo/Idh/MocA family oxidoreductase [Clostridiaceae bacterium]|nr:Gfo/Idh/MocA family oxidoreductase [Clostridiaceae bacterium]
MAKKELGFGIIGCRMGMSHARGLRACKGGKLVALCDKKKDILKTAMENMNLNEDDCYTDYKDLLKREDIDVVVVATPDQLHPEHTIAALEAGKHVLCEKPMAMTVEECKEMMAVSIKTEKKLMIGQICRYTPGFMAAKRLIDRGEIGDLFFVESEYAHDYSHISGVDNWRIDPVRLRHPALGGGCHAVDLLRWIVGDPYEVCAFSNKKVLTDWPVDDCTIGMMKFPNNVIGKVFVSVGCKRDYTMRSVFYGTKGTIITDNTSNFMTVFKEKIADKDRVFEGVSDQGIGIKYPVAINNHNTIGELSEFIDIILNDKPVKTDAKEGTSTVAVCLALVESAAAYGKNVKLSYDF